MMVAELANLGGISGRHRIKVARVSSFHEDWIRGFYSEYIITPSCSIVLKLGFTGDVVIR